MKKLTLAIPNAIVFLYDPGGNNIEIPEYVDTEIIARNDGCISIGTQADVDGEVELALCSSDISAEFRGLNCVFRGSITSPSKRIAFSTSEDEAVIALDVKNEQSDISVWIDDTDFPSKVLAIVT